MRRPVHGSRLLLVSPYILLLLSLGIHAHWGLGPFHVNLFALLICSVLFVALPELDALDTSAAARLLRLVRTALMPITIAAVMAKSTFDYWVFSFLSELYVLALLLLCRAWESSARDVKRQRIAAFLHDGMAAISHSKGSLYCFATALLMASAAEEQRRTAFHIFVRMPRPAHAPVSALVAGTLMLGAPWVVFVIGRVAFGLSVGHTCMEGDLCRACCMSAALAAVALLTVVHSVVHVPQAILLLTARGRTMTLIAVCTVVAVALLWQCLVYIHISSEKLDAQRAAAEIRTAV